MCPECSRKDWRDTSCWLRTRESDPEVDQGPSGVTISPTLFVPILGVDPAELSEIAVDPILIWQKIPKPVFRFLLGLLPPRPLPLRKNGHENEWMKFLGAVLIKVKLCLSQVIKIIRFICSHLLYKKQRSVIKREWIIQQISPGTPEQR